MKFLYDRLVWRLARAFVSSRQLCPWVNVANSSDAVTPVCKARVEPTCLKSDLMKTLLTNYGVLFVKRNLGML